MSSCHYPMAYDQHIRDAASLSVRCAILTLSDTRTQATDASGARIRQLLLDAGHAVVHYRLLPDEPAQLEVVLGELLLRPDVDAIISNGGTGISRRDQTIPAIRRHLDSELSGFGELFRLLSFQQIGSGAMLSRALAGVARGKILFCLPGSPKAVELAMTQLILPQLRHVVSELRK